MILKAPMSPRGITKYLSLAFLACTLTAPATLIAKQSDRDKPVNVDANEADALATANGKSHLNGDVVIVQGTLKAHADHATINFDENTEVKHIQLTGNPARLQQLDENDNLVKGHANTIDYDVIKGVAVFTGDAFIDQVKRGSARGNKLIYNTVTSTMQAKGDKDSRVHLIFQPDKQNNNQK